ncbi:MAG: hypothetical protein RL291_505 [Pseudomonadota bacterium]
MTNRYTPDEDLPRTLIREKAARQAAFADGTAAQRGQSFDPPPQGRAGAQPAYAADDGYPGELPPVAVQRFEVPFFRLAWFMIKCVLAGIPALLLLFVILWGMGQAIQKFLPWLVKMRILISFQ